jgi:hypothetical protein
MFWWLAAGGLSLSAFAQNAPVTVPIPGDPLEMVAGRIRAADAHPNRAAAIRLLDRARAGYALRRAGRGYDLKVSFTVDSGGQTEYDGAWKMEDVFDPQQGHRWAAHPPGSNAIVRIFSNGTIYGEDTLDYIPLRLQETRAALFDPIPSSARVARASIRTATAIFRGAQLTCILLSGSGNAASATSSRRWDESEDCVDRKSGLLRMHSQVPGRYYAYEYSGAPRLADCILPRKVTVTEAGKTVTEISVDSLTELPSADPGLFVPTEQMRARGVAISMAGAQKIFRDAGQGSPAPSANAHIVCVFGVVTPAGQFVEAHSLQPSDPDSQAAVETAKQMTFPPAPGTGPRQYFAFVIERFGSTQ